MSETGEHAHELIDRIPDTQLSRAVGLLEKILDPVTLALLNAPTDDEPTGVKACRGLIRIMIKLNAANGTRKHHSFNHMPLLPTLTRATRD